jgi:hypothetical protein
MQARRPIFMRFTRALGAIAAVGLVAVPLQPVLAEETPEPYTFISMPDFLNADIGDTRASSRWEPGDPNSINASYRLALDVVLDEVQAEAPSTVLVAGDLVEGHWGVDVENTGIFGPTSTFEQKKQAVSRAGDLYYSQWKKRFTERGLTVFPAVGDHEIGDNPWPSNGFKRRAFHTFKSVWAKHFAGTRYPLRPVGTPWEKTAYAVYLTPDVLLVSVDVFVRIPDNGDSNTGGVTASVRGGQLAWLDGLLASTTAKHVIVQGHTPVLGPVRLARSSGLMHEGGGESPFWQTLERHDGRILNIVYLCGEVHDVTAHAEGGVIQIAHGNGIIAGSGPFNYLEGRVYPDRLELEVKRIARLSLDDSAKLWATSWKRPPIGVSYAPGATTTGTAVIGDDGIRTLTGEFEPWSGN